MNGLTPGLQQNNPNPAAPFRLDRSQFLTQGSHLISCLAKDPFHACIVVLQVDGFALERGQVGLGFGCLCLSREEITAACHLGRPGGGDVLAKSPVDLRHDPERQRVLDRPGAAWLQQRAPGQQDAQVIRGRDLSGDRLGPAHRQ